MSRKEDEDIAEYSTVWRDCKIVIIIHASKMYGYSNHTNAF